MAFKEIMFLLVLISMCCVNLAEEIRSSNGKKLDNRKVAVPVWENEAMQKREDVSTCSPFVKEKMIKYGVDVSKLQCVSQTRVRRSCCLADCTWMAVELGVEPSTLVCPT